MEKKKHHLNRTRPVKRLNNILERRKHQFISLLDDLKKKQLIVSYKISDRDKSDENHVLYDIYFLPEIFNTIIVDFDGKFDPKSIFNAKRFTVIKFLSGWSFNEVKKSIINRIEIFLISYKKGVERECRVENILKKEKRKPHSLIAYVMKGKKVSDAKGKDMFVGYRDKHLHHMVPLQIKSKREHQRQHMIKYPHIPSIIIQDTMTDEDVLKKILEICENYIKSPKRIILHF